MRNSFLYTSPSPPQEGVSRAVLNAAGTAPAGWVYLTRAPGGLATAGVLP
jgi:hypothetical protein